jgi:hypothetical protein
VSDAETGQRFESRAITVDLLSRAGPFAWVLFVVSLVVLAAATFAMLGAAGGGVVVLLAIAGGALGLRRLRWLGPGSGNIAIDASRVALRFEGRRGKRLQRSFATGDITSGYRTDDEVHLRLMQGDRISIQVEGAESGEALLRAVGQDARRRVLEMKLPSAASRYVGLTTFAWLTLATQLPSIPFMLFFLLTAWRSPEMGVAFFFTFWTVAQTAVVAVAVQLLRPRRVAVGIDGIVVRPWWRDRFLSYDAIAKVDLVPRGVSLGLRTGRVVKLRTTTWRGRGYDAVAQALFERIQSARGAAVGDDAHAKLQLLERRGRTLVEWRAHLAALADKSGYRTGAITVGDLAAVVADGSLSAEHRIAATLALATADRGEARARARIALEACADKDLRAALEEAAEGDVDDARVGRLLARS